ncbi:Leucine-rich repeat-containing protein 48 [Zootermopsis nevadensis]|nr:Leucine-rich repeat-containing protein 48 [Zootermopsis nevadensis]
MENLVNLMIFSIGNNQIKSRNDVIYLRQFPCLRSLNMAGNPCVENGDKDFQEYICAFLPKLTYYEYHIISAEERATAEISYRTILKRLEETEEKERQSRMEAEARAKEMAFHAEAFVENLDRDQLFNAMFENDANGKTLLTMGEAAMDVYNKFHDETMKVIHQLFKLGLEQHEIRQEEIRQYFKCVDAAKEENKISSQQ